MFIEITAARVYGPGAEWDPDTAALIHRDPAEYTPDPDVSALESALGLGWDDPTEPPADFVVDGAEDSPFRSPADELAVRRQVRALTPADIEGRAA